MCFHQINVGEWIWRPAVPLCWRFPLQNQALWFSQAYLIVLFIPWLKLPKNCLNSTQCCMIFFLFSKIVSFEASHYTIFNWLCTSIAPHEVITTLCVFVSHDFNPYAATLFPFGTWSHAALFTHVDCSSASVFCTSNITS